MSPGAAPPLPSQLKVHLSFCSANLWLIVESFVSFDQAFPCCCFVCDLPTELSRSHHFLTLTPVGGTPCRLSTSVRLTSLKCFRSTYKPTTLKSISRIVHLKDRNLCGAKNSQEHPPKSSTPPPPLVGLKSIQSNKTF